MAIEFFSGDIAVSSKTGNVFTSSGLDGYGTDSNKASASPIVTTGDFSMTQWSPWGTNNLMPKEIADDIENCGVLAAALDAKSRIGTGKGMQPFLLKNITSDGKEELEWIKDREIHDWLELNEGFEFGYDSSFDKHAYGWNAGSYVLNLGRNKIYRVKRHDVYEARLEKKDKSTRRINSLYLSSDWANAGSVYDAAKQVRIDLLEEGNELNDLQERIAGNSNKVEFGFVNRTIRNGRHYYPIPLYRSNKLWIKIARSVPATKIALFKNAICVPQIVYIHKKFWEDKVGQLEWEKATAEQKKVIQEDYYTKIDEWLTGEGNFYKTLFAGEFIGEEGKSIPYVRFEPLKNQLPDGAFLPDSGAANSEILFALMINPALMGAGNPGGKAYGDTSGGSNVRESFLVQIMIMEAERRLNASVFNVVKRFNGWSKKHEGDNGENGILVFRYPSGLLTTLDTGKSTKPENL